jgi:hypothetical protein
MTGSRKVKAVKGWSIDNQDTEELTL